MLTRALLVAIFLLGSTAEAQSRVSGVVTAPGNSSQMEPLADAYVIARIEEQGLRTAAATQTDSQGRYTLEGLPEGRVTLTVEAQGYYVASAGGVESASIARTCPAEGECPRTDFELAKTGVVEVWVTDAFGDPIQGLEIRIGSNDTARNRPHSLPTSWQRRIRYTDDRGYFRAWGLPPGDYVVIGTDPRARFGGRQPAPLTQRMFHVAPGGDANELRLSVNSEASRTFTASGRVSGLPEGAGKRFMIEAQSTESSVPFPRRTMLRNGAFELPQLSPGTYIFRLAVHGDGPPEILLLGQVDISGDVSDLELSPQPPTGVRGRIVFQDSPPGNVAMRLRSGERATGRFEMLRPEPDYTFDHGGIAPGRWTLEAFGGYYLVEPVTIDIAPGQMTDLEVVVSSQFAQVSGTARLQEGETVQAAAQFVVGVRGPRGSFRTQADDEGRFSFERVIPGEYRIAAWSRQDVDIDSEAAWEEAGGNAKEITLEPGFEVDVDLTVTP